MEEDLPLEVTFTPDSDVTDLEEDVLEPLRNFKSACLSLGVISSEKAHLIVKAADEVIQNKLVRMGGEGGIIGIDARANISYSFNTPGMYRAGIDKTGKIEIAIFR